MDLSFLVPHIPFISILLLVGIIIVIAHFSDTSVTPFTVYDLIQDKGTGKGSVEKIFVVMAGLGITWWFLHKPDAGWEDVLVFGGIMGLSKLANYWLSIKAGTVKPIQSDKTNTNEG